MNFLNKIKVITVLITILYTTIGTAQIAKAEIRATGLTCSMCSNAINKQLKTLPEVVNVETDLNTNTFVVELKDGNTLTPLVFKEKVEKAGFFIGSLIITVDSDIVLKKPYIIVKDSQNMSKQVQIQILDKGFVTEKEFRKLVKSYKSVATFNKNNEDVFHIKILN